MRATLGGVGILSVEQTVEYHDDWRFKFFKLHHLTNAAPHISSSMSQIGKASVLDLGMKVYGCMGQWLLPHVNWS